MNNSSYIPGESEVTGQTAIPKTEQKDGYKESQFTGAETTKGTGSGRRGGKKTKL